MVEDRGLPKWPEDARTLDSMSPFRPALETMEASGSPTFGPAVFQDYLSEHFGDEIRNSWRTTASWLSPQSLRGPSAPSLDSALQDAGVMVFRLGTGPQSSATSFALIKAESLDDFFLFDENLVAAREVFDPQVAASDLFPFELLGSMVEANALNLAIASGLLQEALGVDADSPRIGPTTGTSTYTFHIRPHAQFPDLEWTHENGQVETDALYFARRREKWTLFVIEAKQGRPGSLPKHKLVYPALALSAHQRVREFGEGVDIVPVYLKAWTSDEEIFFQVVECAHEGMQTGEGFISDLTPVQTRLLAIPRTEDVFVGSLREEFEKDG